MATQVVGRPQVIAIPVPREYTVEDLVTQLSLTEDCLGPIGQPLHERVDGIEDVQPDETDLPPIRMRRHINIHAKARKETTHPSMPANWSTQVMTA